jgi:capsular polysaccharide biosynthesis protein
MSNPNFLNSLELHVLQRTIQRLIKIVIKKITILKIHGIFICNIMDMDEDLVFPEATFSLPDQLDVLKERHQHLLGYTCQIPPFYVRSIKNAKCIVGREEIFTDDDHVITEYTSQKVNSYIHRNRLKLNNPQIIHGSVANLSLSGLENNYYHWLTEYLGRYYLLEKSKFKPDFYILSDNLSFQKQYIELLGIDQDRILHIESNIVIQADEIIVPSFINNWEYVKFRGYESYQKQWLPNWIGNIYREKLKLGKTESKNNRIYISRAFSDYRKIENEQEIIEVLKSRGFGIYCLENMSVKEQIDLFSNASIVLGAHGAGLSNIYFCPQNTMVCELFGQYYHNSSYSMLSNVLGLKYTYIVGKTKHIKNVHPQKENMYISLEQLEIFLGAIDDFD